MSSSQALLWKPLVKDDVRLHLKIPYDAGNRDLVKWLCGARSSKPIWDRETGHWRVARTHYRTLMSRLPMRFETITVYEDYATQEMCTEACAGADPDSAWECTCICGGRFHAGGIAYGDAWVVVGDGLHISTTYGRRVIELRS